MLPDPFLVDMTLYTHLNTSDSELASIYFSYYKKMYKQVYY